MSLINRDINLILTQKIICIITNSDKKRYVLVVTLSTQDFNTIATQLKSCFRSSVNQIKYQSKVKRKRQNQILDQLIDPSFQILNRLFISLFEYDVERKRNTGYFLLKVEIKDYNIMIGPQNVFDQPVRNDLKPYDNIQKIVTG